METPAIQHLQFEPDEALKPYIHFYLYFEFPVTDQKFYIPADRRHVFMNILEGDVEIFQDHKTYVQDRHVLRGAFTEAFNIKFLGDTFRCLGAQFKEQGLHAITGAPSSNFCNTFTPTLNYYQNKGQELLSQIEQHQNSPEKLVQLYNNFFLSCIEAHDKKYNHSFEKVHHYARSVNGFCKVSELANMIHVHEKTIHDYFKKYTGVPAKKYLNILQFEEVCREMILNNNADMHEIADRLGFHDQSHFIHHFQRYAGTTPGKFDNLDTAWHAFIMQRGD